MNLSVCMYVEVGFTTITKMSWTYKHVIVSAENSDEISSPVKTIGNICINYCCTWYCIRTCIAFDGLCRVLDDQYMTENGSAMKVLRMSEFSVGSFFCIL